MRIKFTFDDYENPSLGPSVHFDPAVVQLPPKDLDLPNTYDEMALVRHLPPNSTIVRFPNSRPFPATSGSASYDPISDNPRQAYNGPTGPNSNTEEPYSNPRGPNNNSEGRVL